MKFYIILVIFVLEIVNPIQGLQNGLAKTPPMGWMHWQRYRCTTDCNKYPDDCVSEKLFKRVADTLVSEGYAAAGYEYVIIDDCWMERKRDLFTQKLVPDRKRFPNGLKYLADYIHGKGLKFGLYENYGTNTCSGYPGVIHHMKIDAQTFAEWDVDYVKLDGCNVDPNQMAKGYQEFGNLLNKTGRPMVYSCSWPSYQEQRGIVIDYETLKKTCNLWRNWRDITDTYGSLLHVMDYMSSKQDELQPLGGQGHWNDPDMLILGNYGLSYDQSKTQMAVWAILAAPLIMSNDLRSVRPEIKNILLNRAIIEVNQDKLGIQGQRILKIQKIEVWARPISPANAEGNYSYAIAFVSRQMGGGPLSISVTLKKLGLLNNRGYKITDLFGGATKGRKFKQFDTFDTRVNPTGVTFYKFTAL